MGDVMDVERPGRRTAEVHLASSSLPGETWLNPPSTKSSA